jgi:hypothetical protein
MKIVSALALLFAVAAAAAVSALGSNAVGTTSARTTFRVVSEGIANVDVDSDGDGTWSIGDLRVSRWDDLDKEGGTKIGWGSAVCTAIDLATGRLSCTGSDSLPRGTVIWHGVRDESLDHGSFRWTIAGGTGKYRHAGGRKSVEVLTPTTSRAVYELDANGLDSSLDSQGAYDYMGRRPERLYQQLGLPCALWSGGWVPDPDPWWQKNGGKRATWTVQLCWTVEIKKR